MFALTPAELSISVSASALSTHTEQRQSANYPHGISLINYDSIFPAAVVLSVFLLKNWGLLGLNVVIFF